MTQPAFDPQAHVDPAAAAVGLVIDPAHRPGVIYFLGLTAQMAALVDALPLTVGDEPAPVFTP